MRDRGGCERRVGDASAVFFATAPWAAVAAGGLLLFSGADTLRSSWSPETLALTHLGTLGFLVMALVGALYRIVPGAVDFELRGLPTARLVHLGLCAGLVGLEIGLLTGARPATFAALAALAVTMGLLFVPLGITFARPRGHVPAGTRTAVTSLLLTVFLGLWMGHWHVGVPFPGERGLWIQVHLSVGILGWVGGLVGVLSWRALPATSGVASPAPRVVRGSLALVQLGVVLVVSLLALEFAGGFASRAFHPSALAALAALPAAVGVWGIQPWVSLRAMGWRRIGAAADPLDCWRSSFALAFVTALLALGAVGSEDPRSNLLFGWIAIWGWSGLFVHGLLRAEWWARDTGATSQSLAAGSGMVRGIGGTHGLHAISLLCGVAAIGTGEDWLARLTGLTLALTGAGLVRARVQARRSPSDTAPAAEAR